MRPTPLKVFALVAVLIVGGLVAEATAVPIVFTHTGVGSGTIGAAGFADNPFTITAIASTTDRTAFGGGFFINNIAAEISIAGVGIFSFVTPTRYFVNNSLSIVGFSRAGVGGADLYNGPTNPAFATWDMLSSIGPFVGLGTLLQWALSPVITSGGVLVFNDGTSEALFMARLGGTEIPESGTLALMSIGLVIVAYSIRRRIRGK